MNTTAKLFIGIVMILILFAFTIVYSYGLSVKVTKLEDKIYELEEQVDADEALYDIQQAEIILLRMDLDHTIQALEQRLNLLKPRHLRSIGKNLYIAEKTALEAFEVNYNITNEELLRSP